MLVDFHVAGQEFALAVAVQHDRALARVAVLQHLHPLQVILRDEIFQDVPLGVVPDHRYKHVAAA